MSYTHDIYSALGPQQAAYDRYDALQMREARSLSGLGRVITNSIPNCENQLDPTKKKLKLLLEDI